MKAINKICELSVEVKCVFCSIVRRVEIWTQLTVGLGLEDLMRTEHSSDVDSCCWCLDDAPWTLQN